MQRGTGKQQPLTGEAIQLRKVKPQTALANIMDMSKCDLRVPRELVYALGDNSLPLRNIPGAIWAAQGTNPEQFAWKGHHCT